MEVNCSNCRFWQPDNDPPELEGFCRRHAPHPVIQVGLMHEDTPELTLWPITYKNDVCGEHQPPAPTQPQWQDAVIMKKLREANQ